VTADHAPTTASEFIDDENRKTVLRMRQTVDAMPADAHRDVCKPLFGALISGFERTWDLIALVATGTKQRTSARIGPLRLDGFEGRDIYRIAVVLVVAVILAALLGILPATLQDGFDRRLRELVHARADEVARVPVPAVRDWRGGGKP